LNSLYLFICADSAAPQFMTLSQSPESMWRVKFFSFNMCNMKAQVIFLPKKKKDWQSQ